MARTTVTLGVAILLLMLSATVLTVVFATRGAMAGNGHVIEVLHFVGAEARFIATEFRRHFLLTGMKGAAAGGAGRRHRLHRLFLLVVAQSGDAGGRPGTAPCSAISPSAWPAMPASR